MPDHIDSDINVVPLIDVLLVLLVVLLISLPVVTQQLTVNLPRTATAPQTNKPAQPLRVVIDQLGKTSWPDGKDFSDAHRSLQIEADAKAPYEALAQVVAEASSSGLSSIRFVTLR